VRRLSWVSILLAVALGCTRSNFSGTPREGSGGAGASGAGNAGAGGSSGGSGQGAGGSSSGSAGQSSGGGGGGAGGGTSGSGGKGGESGKGVSGQAGDDVGESGAGGEDPVEPTCTDGASCPDGLYCDARGRCAPCTDLTMLDDPAQARFAPPEPLSIQNAATSLHYIRYPRVFGDGNALIYEREFFGHELWLTGNPMSEVGAPFASPVGQLDFDEGAALWFGTRASGALASYNLIFTRTPTAGGPSELYAADVEPNGATTAIARLPAPFNATAPTSESSFSMAVSQDRAWWMVNRDSMLDVRFYTAPLDESAPPSVVALRQQNDCLMTELDLGAWVTPDGKLLFVNAAERDSSCQLLSSDTRDIVVFKLDDAGQALGPGRVLPDIHQFDFTEADASLSADMCWLYFTKMQDTGLLGAMRTRRDG
jgi:hypothetical protein